MVETKANILLLFRKDKKLNSGCTGGFVQIKYLFSMRCGVNDSAGLWCIFAVINCGRDYSKTSKMTTKHMMCYIFQVYFIFT